MKSACAHAALVALCALTLLPIVWTVSTSLKPSNATFSLDLVAPDATLANYAEVYRAVPFLRMIGTTLLVAVATTVATLGLSVGAAYAFARWSFPGRGPLFLAFAGSLLIPFQVTMVPNYMLVGKLGWLNTPQGLIVPQLGSTIGVGLGVFVLRQHFRAFPTALFDAAAIDGAGPLRTLWSVVLPNARPALAAVSILVFLHSWNEYFWPLLVTRKLEDAVVQVGLQLFLQAEGNAWGPLMAAATMSALPVFALYFAAQRQILDAFVRSGIR